MLTQLELAKTVHNLNKAICEFYGDNSQPTWEDAPEWQRNSIQDGIKFFLENEGATPEDTHNNWMKEKYENGWVYGEVKDTEAKTHPCLVPYAELPENQRVKDVVFLNIIKNLLPYVK